jgi:hypothetical protein
VPDLQPPLELVKRRVHLAWLKKWIDIIFVLLLPLNFARATLG